MPSFIKWCRGVIRKTSFKRRLLLTRQSSILVLMSVKNSVIYKPTPEALIRFHEQIVLEQQMLLAFGLPHAGATHENIIERNQMCIAELRRMPN